MLESFGNLVSTIDGFVWGPFVLIPLLLAVGVILTVGLRFLPWRELSHAFATMWRGRRHHPGHKGELTPFRALMTSLAATIGTGNIVGVPVRLRAQRRKACRRAIKPWNGQKTAEQGHDGNPRRIAEA
ncbi:MAG: alanine:cation symporter family protein [Candidatus Accumulibacter sp.]|jgi:AGCS family alanine or glycine:cation symporter|nr:alanine:cation symporter family protein [Accumulibacter sp.]